MNQGDPDTENVNDDFDVLRDDVLKYALYSSSDDDSDMDDNFPMMKAATWTYSQDRMINKLAMLIIKTCQDFSFVLCDEVEEFIKECLQPAYSKVPLETIVEACINIFKEGKKVVISELSSFDGVISITCDLWSDAYRLNYVCVSAYFIDSNWMSQKKIIAFRMLEYPLDDAQIFQRIMHVLREFGIIGKIFGITLDNHIGNAVVINMFERNLQPPHGKQLVFMKCVCDTVNSIVLDALELVKDHVGAVRNAILFISTSEVREKEYFALCESHGLEYKKLKPDLVTCWNSTFLMLQSCVVYETVITDYFNIKHDIHGFDCLCDKDWKIAFAFMEFLKVFYNATKVFSGVYYPTSCIILNHLCIISSVFAKYRDHSDFKDVCKVMEEKFKLYLNPLPPIICLAAAMDPRIKLLGVEALIDAIAENLKSPVCIDINDVKNMLFSMYSRYESRFATNGGTVPSASDDYAWSLIARKRDKSCVSTLSTELDMFLQFDFTKFLTQEESGKFDVLDWWRRYQNTFPILSTMSRDLLTHPVSTIASDSVFRVDNRVLSEKKTWFPKKLKECMFCVKDWEKAKDRAQSWTDELVDYFEDIDINDGSDDE